jgi:hypothetical protein
MRIAFNSLETFKSKASMLQKLLSIKKRTQALDLLASVSGYKNYQEVISSTVSKGQPATVIDVADQLLRHLPYLNLAEAIEVAEYLGLHVVRPPTSSKKRIERRPEADSAEGSALPLVRIFTEGDD